MKLIEKSQFSKALGGGNICFQQDYAVQKSPNTQYPNKRHEKACLNELGYNELILLSTDFLRCQ
jgi:hypothetical protein